MTLMECTYRQLRSVGLVDCAELFSQNYLNKNRNWYAFQKHSKREFSIDAAVQCVRSIRSQQIATKLTEEQKSALAELELSILKHLKERHCVADVC